MLLCYTLQKLLHAYFSPIYLLLTAASSCMFFIMMIYISHFNKIIQCPLLSLYPIIMPGSRTPYCHGRCVFGGRKCFFHPCSPSPYRTSSAETCTKIAFEIEDDQCQRACHYHGHLKCQECIEENLPDQCSELSGATNKSLSQ